MGGGGPDDGIGARRAGAPSTTVGPGTALAPWQVGVGQERVEGEAGRSREAPEQRPIGALQPARSSSLGRPGQEEQPARVRVCNCFCKLSGRACSQWSIARVELSGLL